MSSPALLPVPPLALHGIRPVFLLGRELTEDRPWAHICWIIPGEPVTQEPSIVEQRLPYADLSVLDGQPYDALAHPGALLALPPLVAYAGQVVLLRGWRRGGNAWWAHLSRLTMSESSGGRRSFLVDLQVAAAEVVPLPGQDYQRVPREYHARL